MRKPDFCLCKTGADQLRSNCKADQRLCFHYTDSTMPLLSKSGISSLKPSSVLVQLGLCRTWSETPKTDFLMSWLISNWMLLIRLWHRVFDNFGYTLHIKIGQLLGLQES